jgi:hypothetical protein
MCDVQANQTDMAGNRIALIIMTIHADSRIIKHAIDALLTAFPVGAMSPV